MDAGHAGITSLPLVPCSGSQTQRFQYNDSNTHFASVIRVSGCFSQQCYRLLICRLNWDRAIPKQVPCVSSHNKGKQCHVCLDHSDPSDKVSLWDCKDSSVGQQANQQWQPFNTKHEGGIRPAHQSLCLTATATQHGMLEVAQPVHSFYFAIPTSVIRPCLRRAGSRVRRCYRLSVQHCG